MNLSCVYTFCIYMIYDNYILILPLNLYHHNDIKQIISDTWVVHIKHHGSNHGSNLTLKMKFLGKSIQNTQK